MDNTERFSDRVDNYVKYRPSYPAQILTELSRHFAFNETQVVADIGSGTGILTGLFLKNGNPVFGVEPNSPMRKKAEQLLAGSPNFTSIAGTAENSTLPAGSVDLVVAGQAFHWFDPIKAKTEFNRITRPPGLVVLIWNERTVLTPFEKAYEKLLLRYATDYARIDHRNITPEQIGNFFSPRPVSCLKFDNEQCLDFDGLKGRLLSASYIPQETAPNFAAMMADLHRLFEGCSENGKVCIGYTTLVYAGMLHA